MNFSVWSEFTPDAGDAVADFRRGEVQKKPEAFKELPVELEQ